ncbi:MAG: hypothetical protein M5U31_13195 [Acidimicrobiia bacterium]|nr:hypothetical protein [Acidimicrobiia bacterium]
MGPPPDSSADPEPVAAEASLEAAAPTRRAPGLDGLITATFALAGFGFGLQRLFDNSFLWHLRTGELILDSGGIPRVDPYSFTASGTSWVDQSWLVQVAYAALDRTVGPWGIRLLGAVAGALLMVLLFRLALRFAGETWRAAGLTLVAVLTIRELWTVRPLAFGLVAFVGLVWIVEVRESWVRRHVVVVLPVLFWLWVNAHGSFALGFVYLLLHFVGNWWDGHRPWDGEDRRLLIAAGISSVVVFVTPLGYRLALFPLRVLDRGDMFRQVTEWASPDFREPAGMVFGLWLAVLVVVMARGRHRVSRRDLLVTLPFVLLALWARRNVAVAPIVTLPIAARAVAVPRRLRSPLAPVPAWAFACVLAVAAVVLTTNAAAEDDFDLEFYPVEAVDHLDEEGLLGSNVFTTDSWAGYLIWRSWPDQLVYMDDRVDMYPREVFDDYNEVSDVGEGWSDVLDRRDIEVVVWPTERALNQVLEVSPQWTLAYEDDTARVYEREPDEREPDERGEAADR